MSIFWLLLSKRALLQMANKFMRAGLLTMVELQSSHWTPKQQSVLREMLKVIMAAYDTLDTPTGWWPQWISARFINPYKLILMAREFALKAETTLVFGDAHDMVTGELRPGLAKALPRPSIVDKRKPNTKTNLYTQTDDDPLPSFHRVEFTFDEPPPLRDMAAAARGDTPVQVDDKTE